MNFVGVVELVWEDGRGFVGGRLEFRVRVGASSLWVRRYAR